jgi:hypothetical protein
MMSRSALTCWHVLTVVVAQDGNAAAAAGHDDVALVGGLADHRALDDLCRDGRGHEPAPAAAGVLADVPAKVAFAPLRLLLGEERPHGLRGLLESGVLGVHHDLGHHRHHETPKPAPFEAVEQLLLQEIAEAALGLGHEHIEGHGRHLVTRQLVAVQEGTHLRPVAVGDHQAVVALHQGHELVADRAGIVDVLHVGARLAPPHEGVAAQRHDRGRGCAGLGGLEPAMGHKVDPMLFPALMRPPPRISSEGGPERPEALQGQQRTVIEAVAPNRVFFGKPAPCHTFYR